jgi:peptidoglycan hydrolase CwlO-like protein
MANKTLEQAQSSLLELISRYNKKTAARANIQKKLDSLSLEIEEAQKQISHLKNFIQKITQNEN